MPSPASATVSTTTPRPGERCVRASTTLGARTRPRRSTSTGSRATAPTPTGLRHPPAPPRSPPHPGGPPPRPLVPALARATRPDRHPRAYRVLAPAAHGWQFLRDRLVVLTRPEPRACDSRDNRGRTARA